MHVACLVCFEIFDIELTCFASYPKPSSIEQYGQLIKAALGVTIASSTRSPIFWLPCKV